MLDVDTAKVKSACSSGSDEKEETPVSLLTNMAYDFANIVIVHRISNNHRIILRAVSALVMC
jgi:hypothetical protein